MEHQGSQAPAEDGSTSSEACPVNCPCLCCPGIGLFFTTNPGYASYLFNHDTLFPPSVIMNPHQPDQAIFHPPQTA